MVLNVPTRMKKIYLKSGREHSGSVVDCLTRDRGAAGSSLTGVTALCSLSKTHYPSLVLVQPRKTRPYIIERLLMGRKESNQTYKMLKNGEARVLDFPHYTPIGAIFCHGN